MNKKILSICAVAITLFTAQGASANGSVQHSGQALTQGLDASGHAIVGAAKLTSGVVAIPLGVAGAIGHVSGQASKELWESANAPIGEPLPISDDTVVSGPSPREMVKTQGEKI